MKKKILVVGGGGREHAIIKALKKSPDCGEIWCAPGNGGIRYDAKCKNIKATDVEAIADWAAAEKMDYVVVTPDDPLCLGLVDLLAARELLRRQPDKADRRVIHLALTDAGAALAREGQKLQSTCLDALFAGLSQLEAERFQELLEKVLTSAEVRLKEGGNT